MAATDSSKAVHIDAPLSTGNSVSSKGSSSGVVDDDADQRNWLNLIRAKLGLDAGPNLREKILAELQNDAATKGIFSVQEREMLNRILRIGGLRVEDVMVPRADIIAIDEQSEITELMKLFREAGHSRIPVFRDTLDDARGMIHIKDLLAWLMEPEESEAGSSENGDNTSLPDIADNASGGEDKPGALRDEDLDISCRDLTKPIMAARIRRSVLFVPPSMPALNLFSRMQSTRIHMALVVDEYGGTDGLVSIEDLVEEVVGEIEDEHDDQNTNLIVDDPVHGLIASARAPVEEFEKLIGIDLMPDEEDEDIETLGGLVFSLVGRVPVCGELVPHPKGIEFEVLEANSRQIKRLKIHRRKNQSESPKDISQSDN